MIRSFFGLVHTFWYSLFSQIVCLFTSVVNKILQKISKIIIDIPYHLRRGASINAGSYDAQLVYYLTCMR